VYLLSSRDQGLGLGLGLGLELELVLALLKDLDYNMSTVVDTKR